MAGTFTFRLTSQGVEELRRDLEQLGARGQRAFDRLKQASPQLADALQQAERSADRTRASLVAMANRGGAAVETASTRMIAGMSSVNDASLRMVQGMSAAGVASARLSSQTRGFGRSTGLASQQVLQLSQQFQDFGIQVAGGQNPLLALAQQGSQAAFIMGGFGAALAGVREGVKALTAAMLVNPLFQTAALTATVVGVAGAVLAFRDRTNEAADAQERFNAIMEIASDRYKDMRGEANMTAAARAAEARNILAAAEAEIARVEAQIAAEELRIRRLGARGAVAVDVIAPGEREQLRQMQRDLLIMRAELGEFEDIATRSRSAADLLGDSFEATGESAADAATKTRGLTDEQRRLVRESRDVIRALDLVRRGRDRLGQERIQRAKDLLAQGIEDFEEREKERLEIARRAGEERRRLAEQEAEAMREPFRNAAESIQRTLTDALTEAFLGNIDSVDEFFGAVRRIAARTAAELATLNFFGPSLGGLAGGAGLLSGLTGGINAFGAQLGFANVGAGFVGPLLPGQTAGLTLSGFLGAGGLGALGGSILGPLVGLNPLGSTVGGGLGAAGGALLGSIVPGIGTVLGGILGGIGGSFLGGLFGGGKSSGPRSIGAVEIRNGRAVLVDSAQDNGGNEQAARNLATSVAEGVNNLLAELGGQFAGSFEQLRIGRTREGFFTGLGAGGPDVFGQHDNRNFGEDAGAAVADGIIRSLKQAQFDDPIIGQIVRNTGATDIAGLQADLAFADVYERLTSSDAITQVGEAIRALNEQFDAAAQKADELGLSVARLEIERARRLAEIENEFNRNIRLQILALVDPLQAALENQAEIAEQRVEEAKAAGADLVEVERLNALERRRILEQSVKPITDFLAGLNASPVAPGTALDRLGAARTQFRETAEAAASGDVDAIAAFGGVAQQYLNLGREVFASTADFAAIFQEVRSIAQSIGQSPGEADDTQEIVDAIGSAAQAEIEALKNATEAQIAAQNEQIARLEEQMIQDAQAAAQTIEALQRQIQELEELRQQQAIQNEWVRRFRSGGGGQGGGGGGGR